MSCVMLLGYFDFSRSKKCICVNYWLIYWRASTTFPLKSHTRVIFAHKTLPKREHFPSYILLILLAKVSLPWPHVVHVFITQKKQDWSCRSIHKKLKDTFIASTDGTQKIIILSALTLQHEGNGISRNMVCIYVSQSCALCVLSLGCPWILCICSPQASFSIVDKLKYPKVFFILYYSAARMNLLREAKKKSLRVKKFSLAHFFVLAVLGGSLADILCLCVLLLSLL